MSNIIILFCVFSMVLLACQPKTKFIPLDQSSHLTDLSDPSIVIDPIQNKTSDVLEEEFKIQTSEQKFIQESLEENISTISFQIKKSDGSFQSQLSIDDLIIKENNQPISNFKLSQNSIHQQQVADMVFVVDVTGSMTNTIETAKIRLIDFIKKSRQAGYHTRMCLVTFGDSTLKKCDKFYDNNPKDPGTLIQVDELISVISKLQALSGINDPGGMDLDENPMRALIDASLAPWGADHQRFAILITDAGFLYSPNNQGQVGKMAPEYIEVQNALKASQMKVFAATPSLAGYNKPFNKVPGIIEFSGGEWFKYSDLVTGKIYLDSILNKILNVLNTTFIISYKVEDQVGLDGSLPLNKRDIKIDFSSLAPIAVKGEFLAIQLKSNLPSGRKEYSRFFKLDSRKIDLQSIHVYLDDIEVKDYKFVNEGISFSNPPRAKAVIKVNYEYENFADSLSIKNLKLPLDFNPRKSELYLNDIFVDSKFLVKVYTDSQFQYFTLIDLIFNSKDTFKIKSHRGLKVKIVKINTEK